MRHAKLVTFLAVLIGGSFLLLWAASNGPSVRGQDANVETRGNNTAGLPLAGTSGVWRGDGGWVSEAAHMNAAEAALADLAQRRATSGDVKRYAAELHRDHGAASQALKALASRRQWAYPESIDALQAQALQALDRSQGPEFDRAFVEAMMASHEQALASFRIAAASADDSELKAFAAKQIPILERHLEHARRLR